MIRLNADDTPLEALADFYEPVELYDSTGTKLLGTFTPADMERCNRFYAEAIARMDLEEWLALQRNRARRLHSEIIEELQRCYPIDGPAEAPPTDSTVQPGSSECVHRSLCSRSGCSIGTCLVACF